jgi:acetylornithine deacetylase/succinyl-diaminopimelate desuccinylase-like protein
LKRNFSYFSVASLVAVACGGAPAEPAAPRAEAHPPALATAPVASPSPAPASGKAAPPVAAASLEDETRTMLTELVAVDTSRGGETKALTPILERLKAAGVAAQIVESSPGRGNLIARIKGTGQKRPLLLIAHVDVVPVDGQPWTVEPFRPVEKDGYLWGRGIGDDKSMVAAFTATVLEIARTKPSLSRDVILALTAGEETGGFAGAEWLARTHKDLIDAEVALNEGGSIVTSPDSSEITLVGVSSAEKSYQTYQVVAKGGGGHSSIPKPGDDPSLELARALVKIGEYRFPARILPPVKSWFIAAATLEKGALGEALRHAIGSAPALLPADDKVLSGDRVYNALVRTTCITTTLSGSPQDNVLPTTATAHDNCRILPDETREQTLATLIKVVGDPKIEVAPTGDNKVGPSSSFEGEVPGIIEKVVHDSFPKAKVVGNMQTGTTDSRHLRNIGIQSYGIASAPTSSDETRKGHTAHGPDERRPVKWLGPGARFLHDVVLAVAR